MTLLISYTQDYDEYFIRWLLKSIGDEIKCQVINPRLIVLNKALQKYKLFSSELVTIDFCKVVALAANNIQATHIKDKWKISINPVTNYNKTSIRLISLCKLVNNGFLGCRGSNIFDKVFNNVSANLTKYYNMYTMEI